MKDKIIQIIKGYECDAYFGAGLNHLKESDYENVAEEIVKLFLIPPVNGQLLSFFLWFRTNGELYVDKSIEATIEIYLRQLYI